jgi:hypothetical protein
LHITPCNSIGSLSLKRPMIDRSSKSGGGQMPVDQLRHLTSKGTQLIGSSLQIMQHTNLRPKAVAGHDSGRELQVDMMIALVTVATGLMHGDQNCCLIPVHKQLPE